MHGGLQRQLLEGRRIRAEKTGDAFQLGGGVRYELFVAQGQDTRRRDSGQIIERRFHTANPLQGAHVEQRERAEVFPNSPIRGSPHGYRRTRCRGASATKTKRLLERVPGRLQPWIVPRLAERVPP